MSDQKHQFRPPLYHDEPVGDVRSERVPGRNGHANSASGNREQQGWDAYRRWMSRVSGQPAQRSPLDPSIYSWKGYHNWADKVRQTWPEEDSDG